MTCFDDNVVSSSRCRCGGCLIILVTNGFNESLSLWSNDILFIQLIQIRLYISGSQRDYLARLVAINQVNMVLKSDNEKEATCTY